MRIVSIYNKFSYTMSYIVIIVVVMLIMAVVNRSGSSSGNSSGDSSCSTSRSNGNTKKRTLSAAKESTRRRKKAKTNHLNLASNKSSSLVFSLKRGADCSNLSFAEKSFDNYWRLNTVCNHCGCGYEVDGNRFNDNDNDKSYESDDDI